MIKPLTRPARIPARPARSNGGFAESMRLHSTDGEDYSGFATTQMFAEEDEVLAPDLPSTALGGLRAAARHLLPLFIGVSVMMALIAALLPLFEKP